MSEILNMRIYNQVRVVPQEAKREIAAGRLKGKTDINPMWRIKALTEQFGVCGIGWKYVITDKRLEAGADGEISAFVDIDLFIKIGGEWSEAIPGTGGSAFVAKERNGLYTSDECFKMALTDAISVACKALGFGADVYWQADATKYTMRYNAQPKAEPKPAPKAEPKPDVITTEQRKQLIAAWEEKHGKLAPDDDVFPMFLSAHGYKDTRSIKKADFDAMLASV